MKNTNSKYLFDKWFEKFGETPEHQSVKQKLENKNNQVVDHVLYARKSVSGASSFDDMLKTDDTFSHGLTNISGAQLPVDTYFMCTAIGLRYAVAAGTTTSNVKEADYNNIAPLEVLNGEVSIAVDKKPILEKTSSIIFDAADHFVAVGDTNAAAGTAVTYTVKGVGNVGLHVLENPKMIVPQKLIEVKLKFAKALATNAALEIYFLGSWNVTA